MNTIATIVPTALSALADAVLALEKTTDADLAQAGRLLTAAANSVGTVDISGPAAQPIFDSIATLLSHRFAARKELSHTHSRLRRVGKAAMPDYPWGPDEKCPMATAPISDKPAVAGLRAA